MRGARHGIPIRIIVEPPEIRHAHYNKLARNKLKGEDCR
jgi:hypothetical protein